MISFRKTVHLGLQVDSDLWLTATKVDMVNGARRDLTAKLEEHLFVPKIGKDKNMSNEYT